MAGRNPLPGILDPSQRVGGRELLEEYGVLDPNQPGLDIGDVAGFGVEMALDPLSWLGGGLAAKLAGRGGKAVSAMDNVADAARAASPAVDAVPAVRNTLPIPMGIPDMPANAPSIRYAPAVLPERLPEPLALPAPGQPFYSRLERAAEAMPGKQVKMQSLPNQLAKAPEGVSKEEMDWVMQGFQPQGGVASKEDLLQHIRDNQIQVKEKLLGPPATSEGNGGWSLRYRDSPAPWGDVEYATQGEAQQAAEQLWRDQVANVEQMNREWLAGGGDPAELAAIPEVSPWSTTWIKDDGLPTQWSKYATPGGQNYRELLLKMPEKPEGAAYKSPHWPNDPNVLAHLRFDERIAPDGSKTLFAHEIQSDWHQDARKMGYTTAENRKAVGAMESKLADLNSEIAAMPQPYGVSGITYLEQKGIPTEEAIRLFRSGTPYHDEYVATQAALKNALQPLLDKRVNLEAQLQKLRSGHVPDAPLKNDKWAELSLKRLLQWATDNGYDRIAWNNGELASKYSAGGVGGDMAKGIAKWYDETLPNMMGKLLKKHNVHMEPMVINVDGAEQIVPSFVVPQAAKKEIAYRGQPLLSLLPLGAGAGLAMGTGNES
jgi:hypothetical protein